MPEPTLSELIELARHHVWTDAEKREHLISFAWGNVALHNPAITREDVERELEKLEAER